MTHPVVFRPLQSRFLAIPQTPLCYWLRERFFELLAGRTLGEVAHVLSGMSTGKNDRFVRCWWESPSQGGRWTPYSKGGGHARWHGFQLLCLDRERCLTAIDATGRGAVRNRTFQGRAGWTYSEAARGSLAVRTMERGTFFDAKGPGILGRGGDLPDGVIVVLNTRTPSYLLRSLTQTLDFDEAYVPRLPLPERIPSSLAAVESACIALKRRIVALDPTEQSFGGIAVRVESLTQAWRNLSNANEAVAAVLHALEGLSEREVFAAYGIAGEDLQAVLDETGTPAGWFPLIKGYDTVPELPSGLSIPTEILDPLSREERRDLSAEALSDLKRRLRAAYEAGPGGTSAEEEPGEVEASSEDDAENDTTVSGARIPIPAETFLEELSQKLEVHPISVYWLLRELREKDGVVSKPEIVRFVEDYLSVMVLRLLGHQWPREVERHEPMPAWADQDGIIPLTNGTHEPALIARVRARLADDFGADRAGAVEREFQEITGKSLGAWLAADFFKRHISQFRKRPIAWQLTSAAAGTNGKRRGRTASHGTPAFACLVYYHRLDADLLPKMRTQYIGPLRTSLQTELGALEKMPNRSADQDARRLELEGKLEELKAFDARLEQVIVEGFKTPALDELAAKEPLDSWTSRDGRARAPDTRDAFLAQERRYDPDLNDGVRVNIAPLERAGLLAADVLATKDVEKAIADRAGWRADERRWCREGKLPQPGWWPSRTNRPREG